MSNTIDDRIIIWLKLPFREFHKVIILSSHRKKTAEFHIVKNGVWNWFSRAATSNSPIIFPICAQVLIRWRNMCVAYGSTHSWIRIRVGGLKAGRILDKWVSGRMAKVSLSDFGNVYMFSWSLIAWRILILSEKQEFVHVNKTNNGCQLPIYSIFV